MAPNVTCALLSRSKVVSLIISRPSFCDNFVWLSAHYASLGGGSWDCVSRLHDVVTLLVASWFSNFTISL
ncbi:hypothetical protein PISMIDRAFT_683741 [Pisolithus microcarpus 441]|uniref:Uncharacterized protein n=1 Tax=Pisolithus microcarpus 441 TaxID=765257 RepID=A0A0C9Z8Z0_9AGAM|nr:hypothetical protein PISMIDRAFT_683741 [Pisolithus microcarpus 441]